MHRLAQSVRDQMESLLLKDAVRVADSFSNALRELETRLDLAYTDVNRLARTNADLQRMHEALNDRYHAEQERHEALKSTHAELVASHAANAKRLDEIARSYEEMAAQHERDVARMAAVEEFLKKFPR